MTVKTRPNTVWLFISDVTGDVLATVIRDEKPKNLVAFKGSWVEYKLKASSPIDEIVELIKEGRNDE